MLHVWYTLFFCLGGLDEILHRFVGTVLLYAKDQRDRRKFSIPR